MFMQTRQGTAPAPLQVTRRQRKMHRTRTEMLAERKRLHDSQALESSFKTFNNSLGAVLDHKQRKRHPDVLAGQQPVSERTMRTTGREL